MSDKSIWENEYANKKLVTLGDAPQEDTKRFAKWLRKDQRFDYENLPAQTGKNLLDAGCGTGRNAEYFAELGMECYGFDVARNAIGIARTNSKNKNTYYEVHDMADSLSYGDNFFDIAIDVTSSNALTTDKRKKYLAELTRVMKPGAYLFLKTLCKDGDENAKKLLKDFPGAEIDMYIMPGVGLHERVFTRQDLVELYESYFEILFLDKKFSYTKIAGRPYKRAFWVLYGRRLAS